MAVDSYSCLKVRGSLKNSQLKSSFKFHHSYFKLNSEFRAKQMNQFIKLCNIINAEIQLVLVLHLIRFKGVTCVGE